jgi:uncharacterized membrane protein YgcG
MNAPATLRRTLRVALPVGMVGAVVGLAAAPALAATTFTVRSNGSDVDGKTFTSHTTFNVNGQVDSISLSTRRFELVVRRPDGSTYSLKKKSVGPNDAQSISASLDSACPPWSSSPCSPAANGSYTFTFLVEDSVKGSPITMTLAVRSPKPAAPTGFAASAEGTVASFSWDTVDDVDGYRLYDGANSLFDVDPSICGASSCAVSYNYGAGVYGTTHSFHAVALRDGASGTVESDDSNSASVTFPDAPASPTPSSGGGSGGSGSGGGSGGGGGATGSGGGATGSGGGSQSTTGHVTRDLDTRLPTNTAGVAPNLPSVITTIEPLPQGTYKQTLAYPPRVVGETERRETPGAARTVVRDIAQVLDEGALWRGLAGAAVLMLVAAHLRAWVARVEID